MLVSFVLFLVSALLGLLVAKWLLDGMTIDWSSLLIVVGVFAVLQAVLMPFTAKMAKRNAPALLGGVGLVSTAIALWLTTLLTDGLTIRGASTWLYACLIVWLVTMLATLLLPLILGKRFIAARRDDRSG